MHIVDHPTRVWIASNFPCPGTPYYVVYKRLVPSTPYSVLLDIKSWTDFLIIVDLRERERKMHLNTLLLALASTALAKPTPPASARLWATHYNGNVYTLELNGTDLAIKQTLKTCGAMPSWLTLDAKTRTVYCSNEDGTNDPSTHGTLTALRAAPDGRLQEVAVTDTVGGGVNSVIYEADEGKKYLAIAH